VDIVEVLFDSFSGLRREEVFGESRKVSCTQSLHSKCEHEVECSGVQFHDLYVLSPSRTRRYRADLESVERTIA
jgi:hypothetical protein